jgi:hypothetical protein
MAMKKLLIFAMLVLLMATNVRGQDSTRLKRIEYVVGSSLAFSLVDYLGYNILVKPNPYNTTNIIALHVLDIAFGSAINYFLYKTCGLSSAISFDLIWWTWGLDLGFYGWGDVINPANPWVNRANSSLNTSEWGDSIGWAGWTPIGLLRPPHSNIALSTLYAQAIIGFSVSMAILW